jgi:hypothetical protein
MIFDGIYIDFTFNNYHSIWVPVKCEAKGNETKLTEAKRNEIDAKRN